MILAVIVWICTLAICQCKTITVNNEGNSSTDCCIYGHCLCNSFSNALKNLTDNTTVNITSQFVTLDSSVTLGSGPINFITVYGNGATVLCNNKGTVACKSCSNVFLEGIIWDQCASLYFEQGIVFVNAVNITISMCTFQNISTCIGAAFIMTSGFIIVDKSQFLYNHVNNVSTCDYDYDVIGIPKCAALYISVQKNLADGISVYITETLFYYNGLFNSKFSDYCYSSINIFLSMRFQIFLYIENSTVSESSGLGGYFLLQDAVYILAIFNETKFMHNSGGGLQIRVLNALPFPVKNTVLISSSTFAYNINGSLKLTMHVISLNNNSNTIVQLNNSTIIGNKGTFIRDSAIGINSIGQGTGVLLWFATSYASIEIANCDILNNVGGDNSIIYIEDGIGYKINHVTTISIISSQFTSNIGSTLQLSNCKIEFEGYLSFRNNTAQSGAAIYFARNSQAIISNYSMLEFTNNVALLYGGAIYVDLSLNCLNQGITFIYLPNNSQVVFTNNSAGISGNSLYFSIPESCGIIRDYSDSNSIVYVPYQFTYVQMPDSVVPEISTSPYAVNLCSTECTTSNVNICTIGNKKMLGQSINFNATACDYYNNVSESIQFVVECSDCNNNYRPSDSKIFVHNGLSEFEVLTVNANIDISANRNITINMTSISSHGYKQISAIVSVKLSPCYGGYLFNADLHRCKCYDRDQDVIQCQEDNADIKYGHWFGTIGSKTRTFSLCPTYYCNFDDQAETRDGYFNLPKEQNDQCSSHRAGMACGECISGYTLAYDSPDCINADRCSPGMTVLVVFLTILYWILVVVVVFISMYLKSNTSLGYVYGILFYYSVVDILLGSNLYISVGVFQLTTILSSFAKLTPQFLGKLCFVQGLSGIDQQFIHYAHAVAVFLLTIAIAMIARRWPNKIASIVSHCIIQVVCLLFLLAYTSLVSTSIQLLRPLYYHDIEDAYVYLSPSIRYLTDRHVAYSIIAWVCGLFIVIGFPLLLFLQPFLRGKVNFTKIKPLMDAFQGCYKDEYHCFAAYYFICRLVIIAVAFVNNALYYLQTAAVIIVMIHIWVQPYKSNTLNMLDGITLLTMILIVNLGSYTFIRSTTTILVVILVIFPLSLSFMMFLYFSFLLKWINNRRITETPIRDERPARQISVKQVSMAPSHFWNQEPAT